MRYFFIQQKAGYPANAPSVHTLVAVKDLAQAHKLVAQQWGEAERFDYCEISPLAFREMGALPGFIALGDVSYLELDEHSASEQLKSVASNLRRQLVKAGANLP